MAWVVSVAVLGAMLNMTWWVPLALALAPVVPYALYRSRSRDEEVPRESEEISGRAARSKEPLEVQVSGWIMSGVVLPVVTGLVPGRYIALAFCGAAVAAASIRHAIAFSRAQAAQQSG